MTTCPALQCNINVKPPYNILKYAPVVNKQTDILSKISEELESDGIFTNTITKSDFENKIRTNYYDMFFYFGEGMGDCIVDENNYCVIYADDNLKDKWIIMTSCNSGIAYAKEAVRSYNAIASIAYLQPLVARFSNYDFMNGFGQCFIEAQKTLLNIDILNEDALVLAYDNLKNLYKSWGNYYKSNNDDFTASLFYANAYSMVYYSKWDIPVTININITPTPSEIWHFGTYIGNAPLENYTLMSGGNLFIYKAIGCSKSFLFSNVPKTGSSYTLTPMTKYRIKVEHYDTLNVYLEYSSEVSVNQYEAERIEIDYRNYGNTDQNIPNTVSNSKNYSMIHTHFYQGQNITVIKPHGSSLNKTYIDINKSDYPQRDVPYWDTITITVNMSEIIRSFDVIIHVAAKLPQQLLLTQLTQLPQSLFSSNKFTRLYEQYIKMTRTEQITKNILIDNKLYSPEDIIKEIEKGSDVGMIFI